MIETLSRSFTWLAGWTVDLKLGARMLVRYPGLTLVGGCSIAFAIVLGAAAFEAVGQMAGTRLPLDEGHRIVGIRYWDAAAKREELPATQDFLAWRDGFRLLGDIGAFRTVERNLIIDGGGSEPIVLAELTASAFRITRTSALVGRPLLPADEDAGAAPVLVIGYDVWHRRFAGDASAVGRVVRLGKTPATIVGVMPEGFRFPIAHDAWAPLRLAPGPGPPGEPGLNVFARLADGTGADELQAVLRTVAPPAAAAFPERYTHLRPEVRPYAASVIDVREALLVSAAVNAFIVLFLVLICANVSALVFARAATRQQEILIRNALGASRGRIIMQLFAESLVLGGLAAMVGLAFASLALRWWLGVYEAESGGRLPFWLDASLSPVTVSYVLVLTAIGAAITGVIPALKVTGPRIEGQLRLVSGAARLQSSGVWTVVIVAQVAATVAFPAAAFFARRNVVGIQSMDVGRAGLLPLRPRPHLPARE